MDKFEHKVFGSFEIELPLKQRHLEAFFDYLVEHETKGRSNVYGDRVLVEAAIKAEILKQQIDLLDSDPALVYWLASEVVKITAKAREIPKN